MTASYVLVTCAGVLLVEALAAALVLPGVSNDSKVSNRVVTTASDLAAQYGLAMEKSAQAHAVPSADGSDSVTAAAMAVRQDCESHPIAGIPSTTTALVLDPSGVVLCSSDMRQYPLGTNVAGMLPGGWDASFADNILNTPKGRIAWATLGIYLKSSQGQPLADIKSLGNITNGSVKADPSGPPLGYIYVQIPADGGAPSPSWADLRPFAQSGLIFLLITLPVGVVFGMLTTRGVIRRLRRLAAGTVGFAAGDFGQRVPESGADEVGQLERHFNQMAARLQGSIAEQRALAERNARLAERSRISRELHDSISQDLFSISTLVGGLRRALPSDSTVQPQLETLTSTVTSTIQEMRALLLELRPTALEEKGLVPALADLCEAYEARVGVRVRPRLDAVELEPAVEQAVFRIAQEGLSNAVRHSEAEEISVRLRQEGGQAELTVADDGNGFDRATTDGHGLGLRLMAERVRELGGSLMVESAPGRGTRLRVLLPASVAPA
jgi:signal transduction histidine kinase